MDLFVAGDNTHLGFGKSCIIAVFCAKKARHVCMRFLAEIEQQDIVNSFDKNLLKKHLKATLQHAFFMRDRFDVQSECVFMWFLVHDFRRKCQEKMFLKCWKVDNLGILVVRRWIILTMINHQQAKPWHPKHDPREPLKHQNARNVIQKAGHMFFLTWFEVLVFKKSRKTEKQFCNFVLPSAVSSQARLRKPSTQTKCKDFLKSILMFWHGLMCLCFMTNGTEKWH